MSKFNDIIILVFAGLFLVLIWQVNKLNEIKEDKTIIQFKIDIKEIDETLSEITDSLDRTIEHLKQQEPQ
tara:strand:- start:785 stop:994 length:210 start_codon:yes stop_codon:yes gene_type:complete